MSKQCQSCGMPLQTKKAGDCRGSELDGTKNEKWSIYRSRSYNRADATTTT